MSEEENNPGEESQSNLVIVTQDEECVTESALAVLANVHNDEASALLGSNELGVRRFFEAKGLGNIGEALAMEGVTGSNMHMLSARDIEKLGFTLGEQLALKNFVLRLQFIARTEHQSDSIWDEPEYGGVSQEEFVEGICPTTYYILCTCGLERETCNMLCPSLCPPPADPELHELPPASYKLTHTSLQLITSKWADEFPDDEEREKTFGEPVCCFGKLADPDPQYMTTTDNIDLTAIEDVDTYELSRKTKLKVPSFTDKCGGYDEETLQVPSEIVVTYADKGLDDVKRRKQAILKVDPEKLYDICDKILSARDAARAQTGWPTFD